MLNVDVPGRRPVGLDAQKLQADVARIGSNLIQIDSSNPTSTERRAAEYVASELSDVGIELEFHEPERGRTSVIARIAGSCATSPALLVHHHLDVVPADPTDWSVHPLSGEIRDGVLWGRGAVDMKGSIAATLAAIRSMTSLGLDPPNDIVLAFSADEEAGGHQGVKKLVHSARETFEGVKYGVGEVGGFSITTPRGGRVYPVQVAEKGQRWMRITAHGTAGHGSMDAHDNPVTKITSAIARVGTWAFPVHLTRSCEDFLRIFAQESGIEFNDTDLSELERALGPFWKMIGPTTHHTANPTMLEAGYKVNVVPETSTAYIDGRFLPGLEDEFAEIMTGLIGPDLDIEVVHRDIGLETQYSGPFVQAMESALAAEDPIGRCAPYCMPGGTDAKTYSQLGIRCFGFMPLRLPSEMDFASMFHGVDERVPIDSLAFSARVMRNLLLSGTG